MILVVPMCVLCAFTGVAVRGMDNNIFTQIGFVVLIGLACKNAILIVEFARDRQQEGASRFDAAMEAALVRLRPIVMTTAVFVHMVPPYFASGAGAEMRRSVGTAMLWGAFGVSLFGIFLTPVFFYVVRWFSDRGPVRPASRTGPTRRQPGQSWMPRPLRREAIPIRENMTTYKHNHGRLPQATIYTRSYINENFKTPVDRDTLPEGFAAGAGVTAPLLGSGESEQNQSRRANTGELLDLALQYARRSRTLASSANPYNVSVSVTGGLFRLKGYPEGMPNVNMKIDARRPAVSITPYGAAGRSWFFHAGSCLD